MKALKLIALTLAVLFSVSTTLHALSGSGITFGPGALQPSNPPSRPTVCTVRNKLGDTFSASNTNPSLARQAAAHDN